LLEPVITVAACCCARAEQQLLEQELLLHGEEWDFEVVPEKIVSSGGESKCFELSLLLNDEEGA
jgi:hypothetical protein